MNAAMTGEVTVKRFCRTASSIVPLLLGSLLALACPALAQRLSVDAEKGQLSWTPGAGGEAVEEYRVRCGPAPGIYVLPAVTLSPSVTSAQIARVVPGPGRYFCSVAGANRHGEAAPSNEVAVVLGAERTPPGSAQLPPPPTRASDATRLVDADEFRIDRDPKALRRHLGFGFGNHACLGSAMGRMELRTAVRTLFSRLPDVGLDADRPPQRLDAFFMRGFETLPLRWTPPGQGA